MELRIDTIKDSSEDIKKAIRFLQEFTGDLETDTPLKISPSANDSKNFSALKVKQDKKQNATRSETPLNKDDVEITVY